MERIESRLNRLWIVFVVYYAAKIAVELALGFGSRRFGPTPTRFLWGPGPMLTRESLFGLYIVVTAGVFLLGYWLFKNLRLGKNWARVTLLVVGWLTVFDAVTGLLITLPRGSAGAILNRMLPGLDWPRLLLIDRITDLMGLAYFGWLLFVLHSEELRRRFQPPAPGANP